MAQQAINFDPATGDDTTGALRKADNNIKDHEARLSALKGAATRDVGTTAGTVAAGDDSRFAANAAAAAAALTKLNPTGTGLLKTDAVNPIANSSGDTRVVLDLGVSNGTDDRIQLLCTRVTANNDWQGTIWRLRRIVNGFQQGMIEFGQGQIATGGAVTINGAVPWTTANTTVDGNNFIKRI